MKKGLKKQIKQAKKKSFTLIELLIVIAMVALISILAISSFGGTRTKARDTKRLADIKQIQTALEMYYSDQNDYPAGTNLKLGANGVSQCLYHNASLDTGFKANCVSGAITYMGKVPTDPKPVLNEAEYVYNHIPGTNTYSIRYYLESGAGDLQGSTYYIATEKGIGQPIAPPY